MAARRAMHLIETYHVTIFALPADVQPILAAVLRVADLAYGNYAGVSWASSPGVERFTPAAGANPTQGAIGQEEKSESIRIEFSLPRDQALLRCVIEDGIYPAHSWEEPVVRVTEGWDVRRTP